MILPVQRMRCKYFSIGWDGSSGDGRRQPDSGCILKAAPIRFVDGLGVGWRQV